MSTGDARSQMTAALSAGPPYPPRFATVGGHPDNKIDVGVSAMFIAVFACLGIVHGGFFKRNKSKGHLFVFSLMTAIFCKARVVTFSLRIALAKNPTGANIAIAAGVFVSAGVIILYIVNLNYAQRIVRGYHPRFGGSKPVAIAFAAFYVSVVCVLIMVIVASVLSFFTLNIDRLIKCRNIQRFGSTYFTVFSFIPVPLVLLARFIPTEEKTRFGKLGSMNSKVLVVLAAALILTLESAFRTAIAFLPPRPINNPAWYHKRAAFYVFLPTLEVIVVVLYAVTRVDQRFYIDKPKVEAEKIEDATETSSAT